MEPRIRFETARLCAENWNRASGSRPDRPALARELRAMLTPDVLRHLPRPLHLTGVTIEQWMDQRDGESTVLTIRDKAGALIGLLILGTALNEGVTPEVHIGYLFAEDVWGKGYATELISGLVGWYQREERIVRLVGGVDADNPASARVLVKNGFAASGASDATGTPMYHLDIAHV